MCCVWPVKKADIVPRPAPAPILQHCFGVVTSLRDEAEARLPPAAGIFGWPAGPADPTTYWSLRRPG